MRIEFLGLPGSGKTTIRNSLLSHLKKIDSEKFQTTEEAYYQRMKVDGDKVYRYLLSLMPATLGQRFCEWIPGRSLFQLEAQNEFLAKYGGALSAFIESPVFEQMSLEDKKNVMGNFLSMGSVWQLLDIPAYVKPLIFLEEGFIQKSFMFVDHNYSFGLIENNLRTYLNNIPLPDVVVHVKANVSLSHERMVGRKEGVTTRLKGVSEGVIDTFLHNADEHIQNVRNELSGHKVCQFIDVVNEGPLDEVVSSTIKQLECYY